MNMQERPAPERLPLGLKLGWSIGAIGAVTMLIMVNLMLIYFMVNYLGIDPAVAGSVVAATRLYDMVFDPAMGWLSDRVETRWGRRRPWMLLAAIISTVATVAVFHPPALDPADALPAYLFLVLLLYFSGYTMFYITFMAMPAEMTADYDERTSIMSYRAFSSGAGGMVATALAPALVDQLGGGRDAYGQMAWIIALIIGGTMLVSFLSTGRARFTRAAAVRHPPGQWLRSMVENGPLMALMAAKLFVYLAIAVQAGLGLFFMGSVIERGEQGQALHGLIMHGTTIAVLPLWVRFVKGKPKQHMLVLATAIWAVAAASWMVSSPAESLALFVVRVFFIGVGYAGIVLMVLSMLPDVIEHDFNRTGLRREGVMSALFAFVEKVSYALTPLAVGFLLKTTGYVRGTGGTAQPEEVIRGVQVGFSLVPMALAIIGLAFLRFYRLDAARLRNWSDAAAAGEGRV